MFTPRVRMYMVGFLFDFAIITAITAQPFYVYNQIGGSAAMSGVYGGIQAVVYALLSLASSRFVHKTGNGLVWAYTGMLIFAVFVPGMMFFRDPWICGVMGVVGFGALAICWPAFYSWVGADPEPERRQNSLGWFNLAWSSGFAFGPLLAGPLYDYDHRLPFVFTFVITAATFVLLWSLPRERDFFGTGRVEEHAEGLNVDHVSEHFLHAAWLATLVANMMVGVTRTVFPKRINDLVAEGQLRLLFEAVPADYLTVAAATKFSWLAFLSAFTTAVLFFVFGRTTIWRHKLSWLVGLQLAGGAGFWVLGFTRSLVVMAAAFMLIGSTLGIAFFSSVYYSIANPALKHRRAAVNEGMVGLGGFVGGILFGWLALRYGMNFPFQWSPLFLLAAVAAQVALVRRNTAS